MFKKQGGGVGLSQTPTSHSQKEGKSYGMIWGFYNFRYITS